MKARRKILEMEVDTTMTNRELSKLRGVTVRPVHPSGQVISGGPSFTIVQISVNTIKPEKQDTTIRKR